MRNDYELLFLKLTSNSTGPFAERAHAHPRLIPNVEILAMVVLADVELSRSSGR